MGLKWYENTFHTVASLVDTKKAEKIEPGYLSQRFTASLYLHSNNTDYLCSLTMLPAHWICRPRPSEMLCSILCSPAALQWEVVLLPQTGNLALPRERKQEMFAIAGLLCTLWEIMGAVQRGRDVPRAMFHISTLHPVHNVWTGSSVSCHHPVSLTVL